MTYDYSSSEEEAFDRLVKRLLAKEWERFPAPSARVWRALSVRLGSQAKGGRRIGPEPTVGAHAGFARATDGCVSGDGITAGSQRNTRRLIT
jgi:hypothetical protein